MDYNAKENWFMKFAPGLCCQTFSFYGSKVKNKILCFNAIMKVKIRKAFEAFALISVDIL